MLLHGTENMRKASLELHMEPLIWRLDEDLAKVICSIFISDTILLFFFSAQPPSIVAAS